MDKQRRGMHIWWLEFNGFGGDSWTDSEGVEAGLVGEKFTREIIKYL